MNRIELLQQKYPEYSELALSVEDYSKGNNKYLIWIAKQLKSGNNVSDIAGSLKFFHENTQRFEEKDINKYKDLKDLENLIKEMGLSKRQEREKDKENSKIIFENDDFLCIRVDDKSAMILYGANTKWCTTMKNQTYYEEYVTRGNDFYILIVKNSNAASSSKYAIVRRSLLDFEIYDANDSRSRSFTESEEDNLRAVVQAIVIDKPPKNYLRQVYNGFIPTDEALEWLKTQSSVTCEFVEDKRKDLKYKKITIDELIEKMTPEWDRRYLEDIEYNKLLEMSKKISLSSDKKYNSLKEDLIKILKEEDKMIFEKDTESKIRSFVAAKVNAEKAKDFFKDNSIVVFKTAARKVDIDYLLNYSSTTNSTRKKKAINEVIIERISQVKVRAFVLNQPNDILKQLME